jgi:glycosyltransferase involved in cell wall biosynthesis
MKLGVHFGVYEAERSYASHTLGQLLDLLSAHQVHVLVLDDASPSDLGAALRDQLGPGRPNVTWDVFRIDRSKGYRATMDRALFALSRLAGSDIGFDYILRVDADLFFNRPEFSDLFAPGRLPRRGLVGKLIEFRWRDYVQIFLDLTPVGFQRKLVGDHLEHDWAPTRTRPVWWSDIGLKALRNGFGRRFTHGALMIMAGETLDRLKETGWLGRAPSTSPGLVFGDDVMISLMVKGLGDPMLDFTEILSNCQCEMFVDPRKLDVSSSPLRDYYLLHPLKGDSVSLELRRRLSELRFQARS